MAGKLKLSDKEIQRFNQDLKDLSDIKEDLNRAMEAGVPNIPALIDKCSECEERIKKFKMLYNPKGK